MTKKLKPKMSKLRFRKPKRGSRGTWKCTECNKSVEVPVAVDVEVAVDAELREGLYEDLVDTVWVSSPRGWIFGRLCDDMVDFCSVKCLKKHLIKLSAEEDID